MTFLSSEAQYCIVLMETVTKVVPERCVQLTSIQIYLSCLQMLPSQCRLRHYTFTDICQYF